MKHNQRQLYAERIERVIRYLEEASGEDDRTVAACAGIAGMSEFHFHRVFRLMTGETIGKTVRRVRLARAIPDLASEHTIAQAAGASGYATPQAFTRAMKQQAGQIPSQAMQAGSGLETLLRSLRSPDPNGAPAASLQIEIVSVDPFRLLAVRNVGDYAELSHSYHRLFGLVLQQMPEHALRGIYGIPYDDPRYTPAAECRFDSALAIGGEGRPTDELDLLTLGGGSFARLRHYGDYDRLPASIDALYAYAITETDREIGAGPLFVHYLDDPEQIEEARLRSDLYLPLV